MESPDHLVQVALQVREVSLQVLLDEIPDVVSWGLVPVNSRNVEQLVLGLAVRQVPRSRGQGVRSAVRVTSALCHRRLF